MAKFDALTEEQKLSHRQELQRKAQAERIARETEDEQKRIDQLWGEQWPQMAGRFQSEKFSKFIYHGSESDQKEQRRIIGELLKLNLREIIGDGTNVIFVGPPGTGKDHLLFCLLRTCFQQIKGSRSVDYLNGADFRMTARIARRDGDVSEDQFIKKMTRKPLLCLSDPSATGGAALTESQSDVLYHVFENRSFERRSTWMTVNLPLGGQLREAATRVFTGPLWERMKHEAIIVPCSWPSFRKPSRTL